MKVLLVFVLIIIVIYCYLNYREFSTWQSTGEMKIRNLSTANSKVDPESLPLLIRDYLKKSVIDDKSGKFIELNQKGTFKLNPEDQEMSFSAKQIVSLVHPAFSWVAKMTKFGVPIIVCDRLIEMKGELQARFFGSFAMVKASGPQLLRGELLRYLAEIPWFPQAIINQPHIKWKQLNASTVSGEIAVGDTNARVEFYFGEDGLIERIFSPDRERMVGSKQIPTPWEGKFSDYKKINGILLPTYGEVSWILPEGRFPYFKGTIVSYR